jgi:hypothetical protein
MELATISQVQALPFVRWVGIYHPAYRVQRALQVEAGQTPDRDLDLVIQTLPDADLDQLKDQIARLGGNVTDKARNQVAGYLYLSLPAGQLDALAALDGVLWVEPYIEMHLSNDIATNDILHTDLISDTLGLTGAGQVIGVADTGLDSGDYETLHPDIHGRVLNAYCWGRPESCDWSDYVTHGTHVVGSILGNGTVSNRQYAGVAPGSSLVMQSMSTATGQFIVPADIGELFRQAYTDTARIHSNSYGSADSTWQIDDIRFDGYQWSSMSAAGLAAPGDEIDENYQLNGGTSMATPLVAGAAALAREWLTTIRGVENPSAALLKALLINGAADMSPGQYTVPQEIPFQRPNFVNGWGRVDLVSSLDPAPPRQIWLRDISNGLETGGMASYTLDVGSIPITTTTGFSQAEIMPDQIGGSLSSLLDEPEKLEYRQSPADDLPIQTNNSSLASENISQLIKNSGFEAEGDWTASNTARTDSDALSGEWSMASYAAQDGWFYQTVTIPADVITATLNYYWKNDPEDAYNMGELVCYDWHRLRIYNAESNALIGFVDNICSTDSEWHQLVINFDTILEYVRGKTVHIRFEIDQDDETTDAVFYFDDIALNVSVPDRPPQYSHLGITLAWTDPPAQSTAGKTLVNDLDLEIIAPDGSTHYYGNQGLYSPLDTFECLWDGKWDRCNNIESILIADAIPGTYQVIVHGYDIPGVGSLPGSDMQPFALVASGINILGTFKENIFLPMVQKQ